MPNDNTKTKTDVKTDETKTNETPETKENFVKLTQEELDKKIKEVSKEVAEKVSATEKAKLYDTLKHKDEENKKLAEELDKLKKVTSKFESLFKEDSKEDDPIKAALSNQEQTFKKLIEEMGTQFKTELEKRDAELSKKDLEVFKAEVIAAAKGELIVPLVNGSTKEEILASVEKAKAAYKAEQERVEASVLEKLIKEGKLPKSSQPGKTDEINLNKSVFAMSEDEYKAYKAQVFKQFNLGG